MQLSHQVGAGAAPELVQELHQVGAGAAHVFDLSYLSDRFDRGGCRAPRTPQGKSLRFAPRFTATRYRQLPRRPTTHSSPKRHHRPRTRAKTGTTMTHIHAAGALIRDTRGRILTVHPTYKPGWEIPGGCLHPDEAPTTGCMRELHEELGLDLPISGVPLVTEWISPSPGAPGGFRMIYPGGILEPSTAARIVLPPAELDALAWIAPSDIRTHLPERVACRLEAAIEASWIGRPVWLYDGAR